jgi:UDP:flavonoid glycosyltransferase YjiC (YdhE family)
MRVLLTTKRGTGHFGPLVPFAHALVRDGAEVVVAAPRSGRAMVEAEGFEAVLFDEAPEERRHAAFAAAFALPEEERSPKSSPRSSHAWTRARPCPGCSRPAGAGIPTS